MNKLNHIPTLEEQIEQLKFQCEAKDRSIEHLIIKRRNAEDQLEETRNNKLTYKLWFFATLITFVVYFFLNHSETKWNAFNCKKYQTAVKEIRLLEHTVMQKDAFIREISFWNRLKKDSERKKESVKDKKDRLNDYIFIK